MAVSDRINSALVHFGNGNDESALLEVCSAIDQTAKLRMPKGRVGERFRAFIHEYRTFIYAGCFGFSLWQFDEIVVDKIDNTLGKLLYKRARNPVVHEAGLDGTLKIRSTDGIEIGGPCIGLGRYFILACILAVIGDPVNRGQRLPGNPTLDLPNLRFEINNIWGEFPLINSKLQDAVKRTLENR